VIVSAPRTSDVWDGGDAYEAYIGRWSRRVAPGFLDWLDVPAGRAWLDVGCGTGALSASILDECSPASVTGVEPSEAYLEVARTRLGDRVTLAQGSATDIPLDDRSVDVVVSGLMLNFVDDPVAALEEMARVTRPGGVVAAYVWDYAGRMDLIRKFWDAAVSLDPAASALDEGVRFPLCRPSTLASAFADAGLHDVETTAVDVPTVFKDFDDLWQPFLGGQGPAPGYVASLDEGGRTRLRERLRESLPPATDRSLSMIARAWAARGATR